jgi:hypothetical protein
MANVEDRRLTYQIRIRKALPDIREARPVSSFGDAIPAQRLFQSARLACCQIDQPAPADDVHTMMLAE